LFELALQIHHDTPPTICTRLRTAGGVRGRLRRGIMADGLAGTQPVLLSSAAASRADVRLAVAIVVLLLAALVIAVPFAKQQLAYVWAFIPVYQTALAITDLMTAGLLLTQFHLTRSRALLVLGCGYLFTASMVVPHTLSYPGLFSEAGLLPGSGPKTTVWLYMFWHGGFPIAVMGYVWLKRDEVAAPHGPNRSSGPAILAGVSVVLLAAFALTLLSTAGAGYLPQLMHGNKYTPTMTVVSTLCWMLSFAALLALWWKRRHSVLDLWLMVVMCAWLGDVALSAVLNQGRFDLGFYTGRVYGLLAAAFVLMMMQVEAAKMYGRLARLLSSEREQHRRETEQRKRIFDTSLDLILVVDRKGMLLQVSPSAMSILGYEPEEMVGRSAASFVFREDLDNTRRQMRMARRGGVIRNFECRYVSRSGRPVPLAWMGVWSEAAQEHFFIGRDMTEQKATNDLVRQVSARQEAVFNCALFGILTLNESGSVETLNAAAERMFGVTADAVVRRDVGRLVDLGGPKDITSVALLRHMVSGDDGVREVTGLKSDGTTFPMDFFIAEMPMGDRRMFVAFVRDITGRKRNEQLKGEFVATVSHELRTPMTSIAGSLGLLVGGAAGSLPDAARRLLAIAHSNSQRLVRLINDILDIEKIESGKMVFALQPVDVRALVEQAIESNRGYAEGFDVPVRLDPGADHAVIRVDPDRMMQVITNLLSNAVKFSPRGEEVVVGVENKGRSARISVRDRGPGIPDDYKARIFEKFVQVDATDTRQKGGTGLGLSIVKQIMLRFGGEVGFDAAPGGGTAFYLELPCWEQLEILEAERLGRGGRALVLLCEDDRDAAAVLTARLRAAGFLTDVAYTAEEAVRGAATRAYAAILVDLQLPDSDGISLIKQLRAQPRYHNTPIVVVSADPRRGREDQRSSALNVLDWLEKPVDTERLVRVLDRPIVRDSFARPRILHLDDDRDVLRLVAQALASSADVVSVESIDEARHALDRQEFDLAVLDVALAEGFGLDLLPDLCGRNGQPIPVVVFSAQDSPQVAARVLAVLSKSRASFDSLVATLRRLVARQDQYEAETREVA
jgi:PAS domain S-box-containing protein